MKNKKFCIFIKNKKVFLELCLKNYLVRYYWFLVPIKSILYKLSLVHNYWAQYRILSKLLSQIKILLKKWMG